MPNEARMKTSVQILLTGSRSRKASSLGCRTGWSAENTKIKRRREIKGFWSVRGNL